VGAGTQRRWWPLALLAFATIVGGGYLTAWLATPYSATARAVAWFGADTGDIDRFPARVIEAPEIPSELASGTEPPAPSIEGPDGTVDLDTFLEDTGTAAFLVARGETILVERYLGDQDPEELRTSFSVAKSVLSAVVGAVVADGQVRLDDPITRHLPELAQRDARFRELTVEDLLTMSSGIGYVERSLPWSDDALTYYAPDLRRVALERTDIVGAPGTFHDNNYHPLLVGMILERATGESVSALLERKVWGPVGMEGDASWSLDSPGGLEKLESGVNARPRDYLRFGMLYRDGGRRGDVQVLPEAWVETSTAAHRTTPMDLDYGYWWWVGRDGSGNERFLAWGDHGQFVHVVPDLDTVIVRLGDGYGIEAQGWPAVLDDLAAHYAAAAPAS
jgi:CubicO group peptidase (beta-lactamase class C family)